MGHGRSLRRLRYSVASCAIRHNATFATLFCVPNAALPMTLDPPGSLPKPENKPIGFVVGVFLPVNWPPGACAACRLPAAGTTGLGFIMASNCCWADGAAAGGVAGVAAGEGGDRNAAFAVGLTVVGRHRISRKRRFCDIACRRKICPTFNITAAPSRSCVSLLFLAISRQHATLACIPPKLTALMTAFEPVFTPPATGCGHTALPPPHTPRLAAAAADRPVIPATACVF